MTDEQRIDEFLNKLKDKVKIDRRTGKVYLPLDIIYAVRRKEDSPLEFEGLPWIFGAYTKDGINIEDYMKNTTLYGHLYWTNNTIILDRDFNINNSPL